MKSIHGLPDEKEALVLLDAIVNQSPVVIPRLVDKPLVLYGAGNLGIMAKAYFDYLRIAIRTVVDTQADDYRSHRRWRGVSMLRPDEATLELKRHSMLVVCIATLPFAVLAASLKQAGWRDVVMFYDVAEAYRVRHPLSNGWFSGALTPQDREGLATVLAGWADNISRAHYLQFLAYRCLRQDWAFVDAPVIQDNRYFIPEVKAVLHDHETFVDVGAHHAEVVVRFLTEVEFQYAKIYAFEPDDYNFKQAECVLRDLNLKHVSLSKKAIADHSGEALFLNGLGYASQLCEFADQSCEIITLDTLQIHCTLLKLHIEGGELRALIGAHNMIRTCRPVISVTCYHNREGLWRLPYWIMDNLKRYRIIMRLHSWCGTGAVIYAIPEERLTHDGSKDK